MHFATLTIVLIWLAGIVGWVMNIITIVGTPEFEFTGLLVGRVIGVFIAPLGAVLGYI